MASYSSSSAYLEALERRSALPAGFSASTATFSFKPLEKPEPRAMNLGLILLERPTERVAGVFTSNRFCGAPVEICRRRMSGGRVRGILINNRIANVGISGGVEDANLVLRRLAELAWAHEEELLPASTGIVGWSLPVEAMVDALPELVSHLQADSILPVARAMMTTDSYPKVHREAVGEGSLVGVAKGAGMIEPNMATMLAFLLTDLAVDRSELEAALRESVEASFNRISVDSDQSTSDMALVLSSGRYPAPGQKELRGALTRVCRRLAEDVVRNGEGVGHVMRVTVRHPDPLVARGTGKAIVNSPLVKTAVAGNDPNVGRIVAAVGDHFASIDRPLDLGNLTVRMGTTELYRNGAFVLDAHRELRMSRYLRQCGFDPAVKGYPQNDRCVEIVVDLGAGEPVEVLGADLTSEYVRENADYRS